MQLDIQRYELTIDSDGDAALQLHTIGEVVLYADLMEEIKELSYQITKMRIVLNEMVSNLRDLE